MEHTEPDFDLAGLVVRARRLGDLSQRDLAAKVGLSQPSIAKIEGGHRQVSVSLFLRILKAGGLRRSVVDAEGAEVGPVARDVVRDNAGRRCRRERLEGLRHQARAAATVRKAATGVVDRDCDCETECWSVTSCVPECSCQCELA